jgi:hypothetical protein
LLLQLELDVTSFLTAIKLSSCEVMKVQVSTRKLGGIGGGIGGNFLIVFCMLHDKVVHEIIFPEGFELA